MVKYLHHPLFHLGVIALVIGLTYSNIFSNQWFDDDVNFIVEWQATRSWTNLPSLLAGEVPRLHEGIYRPLRSLWYLIAYSLWELNVTGYHAVSLLVHLTATTFVYFITRTISQRSVMALLTALLFALHPLHVDGITFIASSIDLIGVVFMLGAFCLYLKTRHPGDLTVRQVDKISSEILKQSQKKSPRDPIASMITSRLQGDMCDSPSVVSSPLSAVSSQLSVVLALFGYFSYEMTLVLPLLLMLYEYLLGNPYAKLIDRWLRTVPYWIGAIFFGIVRVGIFQVLGRGDYPGGSIGPTLLLSLKSVFEYLKLSLWPNPLTIAHTVPPNIYVYTLPELNAAAIAAQHVAEPSVLIAGIAIGLCLLLAFLLRKRQPLVSFALGWFFITLIPFINLIPSACAVCERYTYTAVYTVALLAALGLWWLYHYRPLGRTVSVILATSLSLILLSWYGFSSYQRNADWKDPVTLWSKTAAQSPHNSGVQYKLGVAYQNAGRFDEAVQAYEKTLALTPEFALAHQNLGTIAESRHQLDGALLHYQKATEFKPGYIEAWLSLAAFYQRQNEVESALNTYYQVLKRSPHQVLAIDNIHYLLEQLVLDNKTSEELETASRFINQTLVYLPRDATLWNNVGTIYAQQKKYKEAELAYEKALEIQPGFEAAAKNREILKKIINNQ